MQKELIVQPPRTGISSAATARIEAAAVPRPRDDEAICARGDEEIATPPRGRGRRRAGECGTKLRTKVHVLQKNRRSESRWSELPAAIIAPTIRSEVSPPRLQVWRSTPTRTRTGSGAS